MKQEASTIAHAQADLQEIGDVGDWLALNGSEQLGAGGNGGPGPGGQARDRCWAPRQAVGLFESHLC